MSKRRNTVSDPPVETPELTTQEDIDAALAGTPVGLETNAAKRKRRSPLELFASQKDERALAVADARVALTRAEDDLESAIQAEIAFVEKARAALGL